jgi:hypothetical protein
MQAAMTRKIFNKFECDVRNLTGVEEGRVFFFLKKKEAKKTLSVGVRASERKRVGVETWIASLRSQ